MTDKKRTLHVGAPNVGDKARFLKRIEQMFDANRLTNNGSLVQEFERHLEAKLGVSNCVAVSNATIALDISARAMGLTGEVIVPSFTFIASAHALMWAGLKPVFCDINRFDFTMSVEDVKAKVSSETSAILGVHLFGRPCDISSLEKIAADNDIKLFFDAAHAFGSTYKQVPIGSFGSCEIFSFHATKFCNSFEGGVIATNDDELADKCRLMRNYGFAAMDKVVCLGINGKMSEISAAMGLTNLESAEDFVKKNYLNYKLYQELLADTDSIDLIEYDEMESYNYQYVVLMVGRTSSIDCGRLIKTLHSEGIRARRYFWPGCHKQAPYNTLLPAPDLPVTDDVAGRLISLPTGTHVGEDDIRRIVKIIQSAEMSDRLPSLNQR